MSWKRVRRSALVRPQTLDRPQGCPRDAAALLQLPEGEVLVAVMLQGRPAPRRGLVLLARGEEGEMAVAQRGAELPEGWQVVGVAV